MKAMGLLKFNDKFKLIVIIIENCVDSGTTNKISS